MEKEWRTGWRAFLASKPGAKRRTSDSVNAETTPVNWTQADCRDAVIAQKPATVTVLWPNSLVRRFEPVAPKQNAVVLSTTNIVEESCCVLCSTHTKRNFTFCEISMLGCLRNQHEDKSNSSRVRLARFLLVRCLESVGRCSPRFPRRGNFLPMIEQTMSITPIIFVLVILLFGFDSAASETWARLKGNALHDVFSRELSEWRKDFYSFSSSALTFSHGSPVSPRSRRWLLFFFSPRNKRKILQEKDSSPLSSFSCVSRASADQYCDALPSAARAIARGLSRRSQSRYRTGDQSRASTGR